MTLTGHREKVTKQMVLIRDYWLKVEL